jgi:hypothetical protein
MTKYKYDKDIASLKYDLQQVVYQLDRATWGHNDFDKDWHFSDAIKMLDDVLAKVAVYQQDQWYIEAEEAEYNQYVDEQAAWYAPLGENYDTGKELE